MNRNTVLPFFFAVILAIAFSPSAHSAKKDESPAIASVSLARFETYGDYMSSTFRKMASLVQGLKGKAAVEDALKADPAIIKTLAAQHRWSVSRSSLTKADAKSAVALLRRPAGTALAKTEFSQKHQLALAALSTRLSTSDTSDAQIDRIRYPDSPACDGDTGSGGCDTSKRYTECMTDCAIESGICIAAAIPLTAGVAALACFAAYGVCTHACGDPCQ